jgi:hypothetical protein
MKECASSMTSKVGGASGRVTLRANVLRSRSAVTMFLTMSLARLTSTTLTRPGTSRRSGSSGGRLGRSKASACPSQDSLAARPE